MNFNVKKCKIMKITKKIQPLTTSFLLENTELEDVKEFKDLGIIKQLLDEVEHDIMNYQNRGLCYLPKPKAEADNTDTRF